MSRSAPQTSWRTLLDQASVEQDESIIEEILSEVDLPLGGLPSDAEIEEMRPALQVAVAKHVSEGRVEDIVRRIVQQLRGYGPLEPLFTGPDAKQITEIQITPVRGKPPRIFVVREGREDEWPEPLFMTDGELRDWVRKTSDNLDILWNEQNPVEDLWLDDGSRINAIGHGVNPFSREATAVTIRKSPVFVEPPTLERMVELGTLTDEMSDLLVESGIKGRLNLIFSGPTDSGKTTNMRVLAQKIDPRDHTAIVETSWEIYLPNLENCMNLVEVRKGGKVIVSSADLSRALLRHNLRRAIYGEIRGAEIQPAFDEMQSISGGCFTSFHAEDFPSLAERVVTCFAYAGRQLTLEEAKRTLFSTFRLVVFAAKCRDGQRRITEIAELHPEHGYRPIWTIDPETLTHHQAGKVSQEFVDRVTFAGGKVPEGVRP